MKKILFLILMVCLISSNAYGQWHYKYYPNRQISELNQSELQNLYQKATSLRKTGRSICITGYLISGVSATVALFGGLVDVFSAVGTGEATLSPNFYPITLGIAIGGLAVGIAGAVIWSTGASRTKQITVVPNFMNPSPSLSVCPSLQYNRGQNKFAPGVTVSFRF